MEHELEKFIEYIKNEKHMSVNTELSYRRDLKKLCQFLHSHGIDTVTRISSTNLTSFILDMEQKGFSPATISRTIAAVKSFVAYLVKEGRIGENVSVVLKAPKVEKKQHTPLSEDEMYLLLTQPDENTSKGIRDKAMLELLYDSKIRVTQLVALKISDVNLKVGYIMCDEKSLSLGKEAQKSLSRYINEARKSFVKTHDDMQLFYNCSGSVMSRQGFWKMLKGYAKQAGIQSEITPYTIRNLSKKF